MSKIGIVGLGFVGGAIAASFWDVGQLVRVDSDKKRGPDPFQDLAMCDCLLYTSPSPRD